MSFKASIDIFVNLSYVRVRFLNRQGYIRYRMKMFYISEGVQGQCHPYNIVKGPVERKGSQDQSQYEADSQIQNTSQFYYSRLIPVRYRPDDYHQNETVFFKTYMSIEEAEAIKFYCQIQCLFSENPKQNFEVVGKFKAQIRRIYGISTYLPITFDAFQGFMICSTFHSTIMEFKYHHNDEQSLPKSSKSIDKNCYDFWSYLDSVTNQFTRCDLLKFYQYYRGFLEHEHNVLQNRHEVLYETIKKMQSEKSLKKISMSEKNIGEEQQGFRYVKIMKNKDLIKIIQGKNINFFTPASSAISSTEEQQKIIQSILQDFTILKSHVYKRWMDFANFVIQNSTFIANHYREEYQNLCRDRFRHNVFSHKIKDHDWRVSKYSDSGKSNLQHAFIEKKKINAEQQLWKEHFPIENCQYFGKSETNVKFFQEIYLTNSQQPKDMKKCQNLKHIIVLVHGFQASRADFILFKNCLEVTYNVQVIISACNEGLTQNSLTIAGRRLGIQLKKILGTLTTDYRLSFIGHSMGGLVIRSAIPYLEPIYNRLYSFVTLSSPHLGYLYQSGTLIRAGLWLLNAVQKCDSLSQMNFKDKQNLRETVLYELSKNGALEHFKKICFVCSSLDQYVVYESARIQINQQLMRDTLDPVAQQVIRQMVDGILGKVKSPEISRINVVFDIQDKSLDSLLGRTGHVKFLSDLQFIRQFCSCFDKFFA